MRKKKNDQRVRVEAEQLGKALTIEYRRPGDKVTRRHHFKNARLSYATGIDQKKTTSVLIITGARVLAGEIHG